jgi:7-carboxy-7-deazaguanine synthase
LVLKISEIFYSIQGEGMLTGVPSVFVRLSGCNLRCHWCDTPYASWHPEGANLTLDQVVDQTLAYGAQHAVITGGEPMIFPEIVELTSRLKAAGQHITIETAGTVFAPVLCDLMSISPKLANSTPHQRDGGRWAEQHERLRIQPEILRRLMGYPHQLKFVVGSPDDLNEIRALVRLLSADKSSVMLMPLGTTGEELRERGLWIAEVCKQEGYRMSMRLHVSLWGDERGK